MNRKMMMSAMVTVAGAGVGLASAAPVALWNFVPYLPGGAPTTTGSGGAWATLDLQTDPGEGVFFGLTGLTAEADDLTMFNSVDADSDGVPDYNTRADSPPLSMYNASNPFVSGGTLPDGVAYDAAAITSNSGALAFEVAEFGDEFSFPGSFTVEGFFKTDGDQAGAAKIQVLYQSEGPFRFGIVLNESTPGGVRGAVRDDLDRFHLCDIDNRNYADGTWHYFKYVVDSLGLTATLTVTDEDGTGASTSTPLPVDFFLSIIPDGANLPVGRFKSDIADPQDRTFPGMIDDVQITNGIVSATDMLGNAPTGPNADDPIVKDPVLARWGFEEIDREPGVILADYDKADGRNQGGAQDLWMFTSKAAFAGMIPGNFVIMETSTDTPPAGLFANGATGAPTSYNAAGIAGFDGAALYPQDVYGDEFSFTSDFAVEGFFKTSDNSAVQQVFKQGEAFFRYGLVLNEAAPGVLSFAVNDGEGVIGIATTLDVAGGGVDYADGEWHGFICCYDADGGAGGIGAVTLTVTSLDTGGDVVAETIEIDLSDPVYMDPDDGSTWNGLPAGNDGNLFVGRNEFPIGGDHRTFLGLIDELQFSCVYPPDEASRIVALPGAGCICDLDGNGTLNLDDLDTFITAFLGGDLTADLDGNGSINLDDLDAFIACFLAGCP